MSKHLITMVSFFQTVNMNAHNLDSAGVLTSDIGQDYSFYLQISYHCTCSDMVQLGWELSKYVIKFKGLKITIESLSWHPDHRNGRSIISPVATFKIRFHIIFLGSSQHILWNQLSIM